MVTIATDVSSAILVRELLHQQAEAARFCRRAAARVADPMARDVVLACAGIHARDRDMLREMVDTEGRSAPEHGSDGETRRLGELASARPRGGDADVLAAVERLEDDVIDAYQRALAASVLPTSLEPVLAGTLDELRHRRERLHAALRLAA
jgi:uncharacterized protein (TIGR02284 family)